MRNTIQKLFMTFLCVVVLFGITACQEVEIVHDLTERDANEIMVLLSRNNIPATKHKEISNQEVFWTIKTKPDVELQARSILVANNLPHIRHGGLEGICKDAGLILTPKTERCREILSYKGEIINSLESIPGVVSADVVLNLPEKEDFPDENVPQARPTASVTIQYLTDANVKTRLTEGKVQEFVANGVNGLDMRDVTVIISYIEQKIDEALFPVNLEKDVKTPLTDAQGNEVDAQKIVAQLGSEKTDNALSADELVSIGGIQMDGVSAKRFKLISIIFLTVLLILAAAFIYALLRLAKLRKQSSVPAVRAEDDQDAEQKLLENP